METIETKKKLLDMWFKRVHEHINLLEYRVRHMNVSQPNQIDYDGLIAELERQFENIKVIRKVLKNDAFIKGFNHKIL